MANLNLMQKLSYKPTSEFQYQGVTFIVRPAESPEARANIDRILRPYLKKAGKIDSFTSKDLEDINISKSLNAFVIDWKDVKDVDTGETVEFSKSELNKVLTAYPFVAKEIVEFCEDLDNFRDVDLPDFEETVKNTENFTDGIPETPQK